MTDQQPKAPYVFMQWKGTDACLDLHCTCGHHGHFDGEFAYNLRCGRCGRVFEMPHTFELVEGDDGGTVQEALDDPHEPHPGPDVIEVPDEGPSA